MHLTRVPMKVQNLSIGMFVGMLERPWLETPYIFQGFEIKDKYEIEQLQEYCSAASCRNRLSVLSPQARRRRRPCWRRTRKTPMARRGCIAG